MTSLPRVPPPPHTHTHIHRECEDQLVQLRTTQELQSQQAERAIEDFKAQVSICICNVLIYRGSLHLSSSILPTLLSLSLPPSLPPSLPFLPSSLVYTQVERQTNEMFEQMRGELEQVEEDLVHSRALREKEARESMQQRQEDRQKAEKEVGSSVVAKLASR